MTIVEVREAHRPPAGDAEVVADPLWLGCLSVGERVECAVLVIPEQATVIIVGAAL